MMPSEIGDGGVQLGREPESDPGGRLHGVTIPPSSLLAARLLEELVDAGLLGMLFMVGHRHLAWPSHAQGVR